jgi:hypothetical protein
MKGLSIAGLGLASAAIFGDIGIPSKLLGLLAALSAAGTAIAIGTYISSAPERRCEDTWEREEEDRKVDAFVAEVALTKNLPDVLCRSAAQPKRTFMQLIDEQRRQLAEQERSM